jgi:hypothetical protein
MAHDWRLESRMRGFARYRIRGMIANLIEIKNDTPISDQEEELVNFAREVLEELDAKWGKVRWREHGYGIHRSP